MTLKGKTIKIQGEQYTVHDNYIDFTTNEEVIVLRKPVTYKPEITYPDSIYDLGFRNEHEIKLAEDDLRAIYRTLDNLIGKQLEIAIVEPSGRIKQIPVIYRGAALNDDLVLVEFEDGIQKMDSELFATACYLNDLLVSRRDEYYQIMSEFQHVKPYDELVDDAISRGVSKTSDFDFLLEINNRKFDINEIREIFKTFLK